MTAQFSQATRYSSNGKHNISSCVLRLAKSCCPTAIPKFVPTAVINSLNFPSFLAFTHFLQKRFKTMSGVPTVAHSNSASPIVSVLWIIGIVATLTHLIPSSICPGIGMAMRGSGFANHKPHETSTRCTVTANQVSLLNQPRRSAFTFAIPHSCEIAVASQSRFSFRDNFPIAKDASGKREFSRHNVLLSFLNVVFSSGHSASTGARCDFA